MLAEEILMVNDGSLLLNLISGLLEGKGYHVNLTDSPEEALVLLSTRHIVLVVMKLNGQQSDRLAVAHMVKELHGGTELVIVGESAHLPAEIFEIEADDYILLPCRTVEVWRRLLSSLETMSFQPARSPKDRLTPSLDQHFFSSGGLIFLDLLGRLTLVNSGLRIHRFQKLSDQAAPWRPFGPKTIRSWIFGLPADTGGTNLLGEQGSS